MERAGMYHMPKRENQKSEYSHTIYSNTRSGTKKKNLERHKKRKEEEKKRALAKDLKSTPKKRKKISDGFSV